MIKKKIDIIVNPASGLKKQMFIENYVEQNLNTDRFTPSIHYTKKPGDANRLAKNAVRSGVEVVVAAGGDGTINEIAQNLVGSESVLGIIPLGSGNGLAHHLRIPSNPARAIDVINRMYTKKIDTAEINHRVFVSIAGVGFDAKVAKKFAHTQKRGFLAYFNIIRKEYFLSREKRYHIQINGKGINRKAFLISLANSNQFGYNTIIAPNARLDDGLIDICIVRKVPAIELPLIAHLLYWKQIDKSKYVEYLQGKEITIVQSRKRTVNIDGEPIKLGKRLHIKINPLSLNIITP